MRKIVQCLEYGFQFRCHDDDDDDDGNDDGMIIIDNNESLR